LVVRDEQATDAVLHGDLRVLARDDAFDQDLHSGRVFQALHELPGRRADFGNRRARHHLREHRPATVVGLFDAPRATGRWISAEVTRRALARVAARGAHERLAVAASEKIYGEHHGRAARRL